eukprot:962717-Amphidinium_carterae.1
MSLLSGDSGLLSPFSHPSCGSGHSVGEGVEFPKLYKSQSVWRSNELWRSRRDLRGVKVVHTVARKVVEVHAVVQVVRAQVVEVVEAVASCSSATH